MRWLMLKRAIYLVRRARRRREASHEDIDKADRIIRWLFPRAMTPKLPTSASACEMLITGIA
jgi:hypothetical protein